MSELKPCPFCGENPISHNQLIACVYFECKVNPSVGLYSYEESKKVWNERSPTECMDEILRLKEDQCKRLAQDKDDLIKAFMELKEMAIKEKKWRLEAEEIASHPEIDDSISMFSCRIDKLIEAHK